MPLRAGAVASLLLHAAAAAALVAWQPPRHHGLTRGGTSGPVNFSLAATIPDEDDVVLGAPIVPPLGPANHAGASSSP